MTHTNWLVSWGHSISCFWAGDYHLKRTEAFGRFAVHVFIEVL